MVMLSLKTLLLIVVLPVAGFACQSNQNAEDDCEVQAQKVEDLRNHDDKAIFIDVRTPKEYASGHLPSAINFDVWDKSFQDNLEGLNKDAQIYVYCKSGGRSSTAQGIMQEMGFKKVCNVEGGILEMIDEGVKLVN